MPPGDYVQFGCGLCAPAGWRNFDASPTLLIERRLRPLKPFLVRRGFANYPDNVEHGCVIKGLPVPPDSVKAVYCSHVLEHLSLEECRTALRNVLTCLQPGGCFRLVLPDLEYMIRNYREDTGDQPALNFIEATGMGETSRPRTRFSFVRGLLGHSRHLWLWDYKSLSKEVAAAGFSNIRRAQYADAADPAFALVEDWSRWDTHLGIECHKPL